MSDKNMDGGLNGMAEAAKELRKAILDMLPAEARGEVSVKLDALDKGLTELREATKAAFGGGADAGGGAAPTPPAPPAPTMEEDEEMKRQKAEVDASGETAQTFATPVAPTATSGATPPWSAEEQGRHDTAKAAQPEHIEKAIPWPQDMAHPSFRKGEAVKSDPAKDWGKDPWATE